jgi:hypothetical protein
MRRGGTHAIAATLDTGISIRPFGSGSYKGGVRRLGPARGPTTAKPRTAGEVLKLLRVTALRRLADRHRWAFVGRGHWKANGEA